MGILSNLSSGMTKIENGYDQESDYVNFKEPSHKNNNNNNNDSD
jgi:hypothetical protein